ncbi:olfactory receptor 5V1-like [Hyla sarda]|uniref:olfactory receptor 5V1-like n=1 Tax=Hyla sarda TaxID=327740 RepID=UPI0024C40A73|nr:olfactory receptor 5V1-like [Hyla sarda]
MNKKTPRNVTTFLLLGFSDLSLTFQVSLFLFFFLSYLLSMIGNGLIIVTITRSPHLHSPMYFFLRALSFVEICTINSTVPKALESFFPIGRTISFIGCSVQLFAFLMPAVCECVLLTVMAFDRYMAICHPLRYTTVVTTRLCYQLTLLSWSFGVVISFVACNLLFSLTFCSSNLIAHFFCDIPPIISIACNDTFGLKVYLLVSSITATMPPIILIFCSYTKILTSIFSLRSAESRRKAFSTCGSHLVSVIIYFGTVMVVHFRLDNPFSSYDDRMLAISYCVIIPTINPLIYSLKNSEIKEAIRKLHLRMRPS